MILSLRSSGFGQEKTIDDYFYQDYKLDFDTCNF